MILALKGALIVLGIKCSEKLVHGMSRIYDVNAATGLLGAQLSMGLVILLQLNTYR